MVERSTRTGTTDATLNSIGAPPPLLIDAKAACALLSLGERTLWTLTNCAAIPSRRVGRSVRYSPGELVAWIECGCPTDPGAADRVRKAVRP